MNIASVQEPSHTAHLRIFVYACGKCWQLGIQFCVRLGNIFLIENLSISARSVASPSSNFTATQVDFCSHLIKIMNCERLQAPCRFVNEFQEYLPREGYVLSVEHALSMVVNGRGVHGCGILPARSSRHQLHHGRRQTGFSNASWIPCGKTSSGKTHDRRFRHSQQMLYMSTFAMKTHISFYQPLHSPSLMPRELQIHIVLIQSVLKSVSG